MQTSRKDRAKPRTVRLFFLAALLALVSNACYSPVNSQEYFVKATDEDRVLEPIYSTSLYTVYFDHALMRCVIHAAHTWGQHGGGGGGTGIGITAFPCNPQKIRQRAQSLGLRIYRPRIRMRRLEHKSRETSPLSGGSP
ncbi:MAG: hypothetical protein GY847_24300 [Proteobacteria bacterium]|nr:hypothetical protein [Pseudomonadota bacterium]